MESASKRPDELSEFFDFSLPTHAKSWSTEGFEWDESTIRAFRHGLVSVVVKPESPFSHSDLTKHLSDENWQSNVLWWQLGQTTSIC